MFNRMQDGLVCLLLSAGLAGCDGDRPGSPTAPSSQAAQNASLPPGAGGYTLRAIALSGVITEATPTGEAPIAGVTVYCDACGSDGHTFTETGTDGSFRFSGDLAAGGGIWLSSNETTIWVGKDGYQDPPGSSWGTGTGWRHVPITGADTRFDTRLARR